MNNFIEYFYNIKTDKVIYNDKYYSFNYQGYLYKLYIFDETENIIKLTNINKMMLENTLVSEIIKNKYNSPISTYNGISYILIKIYCNPKKNVTLEEINYISSSIIINKLNINWGILWSKKIDYLEELINENGKKYPLLVDSFNYFIGLAENAISYYNNIDIPNNYEYYICHKIIRFNDTIEALYNPLNITFDYKVRDIAEYIKNSFFLNNTNIFNELDNYLNNNFLQETDIKLLISRIIYPSFYFELYEDILIDGKDEKIVIDLISKTDEYEIFLNNIITYFKKYYDIDEIMWLKKRVNLH